MTDSLSTRFCVRGKGNSSDSCPLPPESPRLAEGPFMTGSLTGYFLSVWSELEGPGHEGDQVFPVSPEAFLPFILSF